MSAPPARLRDLLLPDSAPGEASGTPAGWRRLGAEFLAEGASPDRLRRIAHAAPISGFGQLLGFAVMTTYFAGKAPAGLVIGWGAAIFALAVLLILRGRSVAVSARPRLSRRAVRRATLFAGVSAAPWTALAVYTPLELAHQYWMLPHVGFAGASAGGALILSAVPAAACVYVLMIILPLVAVHLALATGVSLLFSACALAFALMLCGFSIQHAAILSAGEANERRLRERMAELTEAHARIDKLARTDAVTGLMNRRALHELLTLKLPTICAAPGVAWPLFLIDLDHFKSINDACGHDIGDRYLREVAARLRRAAPEGAFIARLGGDEFAVFPQTALPVEQIRALGERLISHVSRNVTLEGRELKAGCSVGAALAPVHTCDFGDLLRFADTALLGAKEDGRGRFALFSALQKNELSHHTREAAALLRAIQQGEIEMAYQPQYALADRRLAGFEALARWRRPGRGLLGPDAFLELAEDRGMALDLLDAIMRAVQRDATVWAARGIDVGCVAINIHPAQLSHPDGLEEALDRIALLIGGRGRLTLEITENCVIGRGAESRPALLAALSAKGYRISLDDFGTGFASLRHLKDLPIDEIKIDRKFTHDMLQSPQDMAIVKAICDLAAPRRLDVIAEGVETREQCEALTRVGAGFGQGFYFARPMPAQDVAAYVARDRDGLGVAV